MIVVGLLAVAALVAVNALFVATEFALVAAARLVWRRRRLPGQDRLSGRSPPARTCAYRSPEPSSVLRPAVSPWAC